MTRFATPLFLLGLLLIPLLGAFLFRREKRTGATVRFSDLKNLKRVGTSRLQKFRPVLVFLRLCVLSLLLVAMARPQAGWRERHVSTKGIDIILAIDVSLSMQAMDFQPDRLGAAKEVAKKFIDGRDSDQIGVVVFGVSSFVLSPLTLDYGVLKEFIDRIDFNIVNGEATAIGMGLATSVDRLKDSTAKSKIVILLTDGENNTGATDPITAAELAKALGVKVYTIGVGTEGVAMVPIMTPLGKILRPDRSHVDEKSLQKIAELTGAKFYRATDLQALEKIYAEINKLETTKREYTEFDHYDELTAYLLFPAAGLLLLEILLAQTKFRKLP